MSTISTTCEGTINKDRTVDIVVVITSLMCVEVAAIVPPSHQALLRCAGSVGVDVYEEVVARGKASLYIECTRPDGDVESDGATTSITPKKYYHHDPPRLSAYPPHSTLPLVTAPCSSTSTT